MLVLIVVCGAGFGWLAYEGERVRAQQTAAAAIKQLGGAVRYETVSGGMIRTAVVWLGRFSGEELAKDVTEVYLEGTQVSDARLTHLQGLTHLRKLTLEDTWVSDEGLAHIKGMAQLSVLHLNNTQVSDAGLVHLESLAQLQWLNLDNTQVSDAGLVHLQGLTQLRWLSLHETRVSDAGVAELHKALRNCTIDR